MAVKKQYAHLFSSTFPPGPLQCKDKKHLNETSYLACKVGTGDDDNKDLDGGRGG